MDLLRALLAILFVVGGGVVLVIAGFRWLPIRLVFTVLSCLAAIYFLRDAFLILFRKRMDKVYDIVGRPFAFPERAAKWRVAALLLVAVGFALCAAILGLTGNSDAARTVLVLFAVPGVLILSIASRRFGVVKRR
jgi:hypothetical protein